MGECYFPEEQLHRWLDAEESGPGAAEHLEHCETCMAKIEMWQGLGDECRDWLVDTAEHVEPLVALQSIRERIAFEEKEPILKRWLLAYSDLWACRRRLILGVGLAMILVVLTVPLAGLVSLGAQPYEAGMAAVVVESLEVEGGKEVVVYRSDDSDTAIIWFQGPHDNGANQFN